MIPSSPGVTLQPTYSATGVQLVQVEVPLQIGNQTNRYFKAVVQ